MRPKVGISHSVSTDRVLLGAGFSMGLWCFHMCGASLSVLYAGLSFQGCLHSRHAWERDAVYLWNEELTAHYKIFGFA